jgi:hypothetical protein
VRTGATAACSGPDAFPGGSLRWHRQRFAYALLTRNRARLDQGKPCCTKCEIIDTVFSFFRIVPLISYIHFFIAGSRTGVIDLLLIQRIGLRQLDEIALYFIYFSLLMVFNGCKTVLSVLFRYDWTTRSLEPVQICCKTSTASLRNNRARPTMPG